MKFCLLFSEILKFGLAVKIKSPTPIPEGSLQLFNRGVYVFGFKGLPLRRGSSVLYGACQLRT